MTTAHLRCGDDLRERLPAAGWEGDYLAFADPVCQGPVGEDGLMAYLGRRARQRVGAQAKPPEAAPGA